MEIAPVPQRATRSQRLRLALGIAVLTPVVLLVLLPAVLGLDRFVVTGSAMDGSMGRGAVVLARHVPTSDLRAGDVITFTPPGSHDPNLTVTARIIDFEDGAIITRGDNRSALDTWTLSQAEPTYDRRLVSVPWIGYPFVVDGGWVLLAAAAMVALLLAAFAGRSATGWSGQPLPVQRRSRLSVG